MLHSNQTIGCREEAQKAPDGRTDGRTDRQIDGQKGQCNAQLRFMAIIQIRLIVVERQTDGQTEGQRNAQLDLI